MNIIAVDDEKLGLESLMSAILKAEPNAELNGFRGSVEALDYAKNNTVDVAFLDIQMRGTNGVILSKKLKAINPKINIIFATGFDIYQQDAFKVRASGYILKPVTSSKVKEELDNLRNPVEIDLSNTKKIVAKTFGYFELFNNGKPIKFKYDKTKELVAVLINARGALLSNGEVMTYLWEDDSHESYLRGLKKDLVDSFNELGYDDLIIQQRGKIGIDASKIKCDYYEYLDGEAQAINCYLGEYMVQYSWGEETNAFLQNDIY